ncbi:MAG: hypothetical protein ABII00_09070 [Elusimicrobiota bacterium]
MPRDAAPSGSPANALSRPAAVTGLCALAAAALLLGLNAATRDTVRLPYPAPSEMRLAADDAVTSASLLSLGMRRLAADIAFVRLLIYYGTAEYHGPGHHHAHHHWGGPEYGCGLYAQIGPRALRILDLDPFWSYPLLYGAGALAFNLERPDEGVALLKEGLAYRPRDPEFLAYMAAIAFHEKGDMARVITELTPVMREPDAPTMLKNMVAFMNERLGRKVEAARLYREILESRDESYHESALRALNRLGV